MPFDRQTGLIRHDATCRSMNSPKFHTPSNTSEPVQGVVALPTTTGWYVAKPVSLTCRETWQWKEKIYLVAKTPGSTLSVPFSISPPTPNNLPLEDISDPLDDETGTKIGFEPLPLAMRPKTPYNIQPLGVIIDNIGRKRRRSRRTESKRQYPEVEEMVDGARVLIGFQKSATLGLGSVFCWVDGDKAGGRRVEGWWDIEERNPGM